MKLSVYLSESVIRVVLGNVRGDKIQIQRCSQYQIGEGTLINDVITDAARLKEILEAIKIHYPAYHNRIHLVVGSRAITKVMQVPAMGQRQLLNLTKHELMGYGPYQEEMVYDYSVIHQDRNHSGGTVLLAGLEARIIESYVNLFRDCGMQVKSMGVALHSVIRLAKILPELQGKSFILLVLDGRNMMAALYVNGVYTYTSRIRFLPDSNSLESLGEIAENINSIIKFHNLQNLDCGLEAIYVCGLNREEESCYTKALADAVGIGVRTLSGDGVSVSGEALPYRVGDYIFSTGNLIGR